MSVVKIPQSFLRTKLNVTCDNDKPLDIGGAVEELWRHYTCD